MFMQLFSVTVSQKNDYLLSLTDGPDHSYLPLPHDSTVTLPSIISCLHSSNLMLPKKLWLFKRLPHAEKIQFTYVESPVEKVISPFTERKTDTIRAFASITPAALQQNSHASRHHLALVKSLARKE